MGIDDIILYFGSVENLRKETGRDFSDPKTRYEHLYAGDYEHARRKFKKLLCQKQYTGAVYYAPDRLAPNIWRIKGYPVREKNKNSSPSK